VIPNERTAQAVAEAVLIPIYGNLEIQKQKPFKVILEKDVWRISGILPEGRDGEVVIGGTAEILISKKDGRVIEITHGE